MKTLKVMTYNIQSCKDYRTKIFDYRKAASVIAKLNPDLIGLNEVRGEAIGKTDNPSFFDQTKSIATFLGYPYYYFGPALMLDDGPYGNAVISRFPLKNMKTIPIPDPVIKDEDAYFETRAVIVGEWENITIMITHIGLAEREKKNAVDLLLSLLGKIKKPVILMGDFNMTPDHPLIGKIGNILIDTACCFPEPRLSFPSIDPVRKIDYIFVSSDLKIIDADIPPLVASDHAPCYAVIVNNSSQ